MIKFTTLAAFALALVGLLPVAAVRAAGTEDQAVLKANDVFYSALNAMFTGDIAPMEDVWSHADDVTYMGPDGKFLVGWSDVSANWTKQAGLKLGGEIRQEGIQAKIGADLATVECYEVGENLVDGKATPVSLRATNVYRKENGEWRMIGHHTDKLPFLEN
ncbi:MAG: nuclear transport factor 2 family protein [Pirellulales bacterium]